MKFMVNFMVLVFSFFDVCYANIPRLILHNASYLTSPILRLTASPTFESIEEAEFKPDSLISISLPGIPNVEQSKSVLRIPSPNDSVVENFVIEIINERNLNATDISHSISAVIIYSFLGVTFTNLCSLFGIICIPLKRWEKFDSIITFMMALAISALFSAALLVLLPEAMHLSELPSELGGQSKRYLFRLSCIPAGLLVFYFIEYLIMIMPGKADHHSSGQGKSNSINTEVEHSVTNEDGVICHDGASVGSGPSDSSSRRCCLEFSMIRFRSVETMAWMILLGDSIHNFMDGVAISAGFKEDPMLGITMCLCVFFEELPHELGDFAVLITSGFSIKSALCANLVSSLAAYLGMIVGLVVGAFSGSIYVFAITTGVFLHISLSDMLPSIRSALETKVKRDGASFGTFCIQMMGLLTGFACVIAVVIGNDYINL